MHSYETIVNAVAQDAALSRRRRLQPIGGRGDKIFPPTYPGEGNNTPPRHIFERRRLPTEDEAMREVWCVLIDSVQSQANRLEEALLAAAQDGLDLPRATVDFRGLGLEPLTEITSLDAPHRVYDAILRDSLLDGVSFMQSEPGRRLAAATLRDASALLEHSPTALLFGAWHSQGEGGGFGAKFARTLVSEIVGVDTPVEMAEADSRNARAMMTARLEEFVVSNSRTGDLRAVAVEARSAGRRPGSRIDPLGALSKVEVWKSPTGWGMTQEEAGRGAKKARPSEVNHSNVKPSILPLGVTCDHAEHAFTLSFAALRRLRFGGGERDAAGRAFLAALGLVALTEQDARGYALRSRCDLVPEGPAPLQIVRADGEREPVELDRAGARELYERALGAAREAGFRFESLTLEPQEKLVALVRKSRELALEGKGGEDDEASGD